MNKPFVLFKISLLLILIVNLNLKSQVTIGSNIDVNKGSILDIKEFDSFNANSTRGLSLPRVGLSEIDQLYPMYNNNNNYQNGSPFKIKADQAHTGLVVYNQTTDLSKPLCPGIYVWNTSQWHRLGKPCLLPICEYDIESNITPDYIYHFYCQDFENKTISEAQKTCQDSNVTNNDGTSTFTYHLMTHKEFLETWNKKDTKNNQHYFRGRKYYVNYNGWITLGIIHSDGTKEILNDIMPTIFSPIFGPPIGGILQSTNTVRCVRN